MIDIKICHKNVYRFTFKQIKMNVNTINPSKLKDTHDTSSIGSADDLIHRSLLRDRHSTRERGASVDSKSTRKSVRFRGTFSYVYY
jgi:hypothetical protein